MWECGLEWDSELPGDLLNLWQQWYTELRKRNTSIARCHHAALTDQNVPVTEVHVFSDASESAYCAAAYLCIIP